MTDTRWGEPSSEQRREGRYPARIVARLVRRGQTIELLTHDVSFRGVFIRTDAPPTLRQLVKFELLLPSNVLVSGHAMVVHVAASTDGQPSDEGTIPGIGLQFWGPLTNAKEWEQFVHQAKMCERNGGATTTATDKVRRSSEHFKVAIEVVLDGKTSMTRDISENGMAIRTDLALPVGARARVEMRTDQGDAMHFSAVVRRTIEESDFRGLGVELVDVEPARRATLLDFIIKNAPNDKDVIFVNIDDPDLH